MDIPVVCPSCGPNGTVSYAGSLCYCACRLDCGSMFLDTSDCTCNPCKTNVGTLLNGSPCDDGDNCTESDMCSNGVCTSGNFICGGFAFFVNIVIKNQIYALELNVFQANVIMYLVLLYLQVLSVNRLQSKMEAVVAAVFVKWDNVNRAA